MIVEPRTDDLLTTAQVAQIIRCEEGSVRRAIRAGELLASKPLNKWLVRHSEVDAWIDRSLGGDAEPVTVRPRKRRARRIAS